MSVNTQLLQPRGIFGHWYWSVAVLGLGLITTLLAKLLWQLSGLRRLLNQPGVFLELIPPAYKDKTPLATEQLFTIIHSLGSSRSYRDKLLGHRIILSLEVVSTREQGIRYLIRVARSEAVTVRRAINSYWPDIEIKAAQDYLPSGTTVNDKLRILDFKQSGHFAYPLANHGSLGEHDPIAYLTGAMTQLEAGELIAFQLVLSASGVYGARRIKKKILAGKDVRNDLHRKSSLALVLRALKAILVVPIYLIGLFVPDFVISSKSRRSASKKLSYVEQLLVGSIETKLSQPLFRASVRVALVSSDKQRQSERISVLNSSLATFSLPGYQSLKAKAAVPLLSPKYRLFGFKSRLANFPASRALVLSANETAAIYHFPHSQAAQTENLVKSLSQTLPAPVAFKTSARPDVILGMNQHHGAETPIGLSAEERERHVYIIGGTGSGKSTMLLGSVIQDIKAGKGLALIDPHGDLSEAVLRHVPEERLSDVIYFNPDDLDHPIGLNLLELTRGLGGNELRREKDMVTEAVVAVFRKVFSADDSGGHRIEYVLRNSIHTALTVEDATLFTVYQLLTDPLYRNRVVSKLEDGNLKNFWRNEFGMAGSYQKVKMIHGITSKIGRFERSASAQPILSQPHSTIDFDDIMDSGKILICNLSKGRLGEDTSTLFGTTILAKLQMAALRRARQQPTARRPFYLYVDEFQNFATAAFVQMLSEARKYKLFLIMAEQSTAQQEEQRLVNIILANVGSVITFRSGSSADERLILPLFRPYIQAGEIASLPAYNFYIRISGLKASEPLSGQTILPADDSGEAHAQRVIERSRQQYSRKVTRRSGALSPNPRPKVYEVPPRIGLARSEN